MDQTMPEEAKPNRRRAVVVTTVFALVLGSIIYYLWTNHAYLKWRYIGGEVKLMDDCLATGYLSPDQVVTLVNSGATAEVRIRALGLIGNTWKFKIPYSDRLVEAIRTFAAELPGDESGRARGGHAIAMAVGRSGRPDLVDVLEVLARNKDANVRISVTHAFFIDTDYGDTDLGDAGWGILKKLTADPSADVRMWSLHCLKGERAPEWAASVVLAGLKDTDAQVRRFALAVAARLLRKGKGGKLSPDLIRRILKSPTEDEDVRASALSALCYLKLVDDDMLTAMLDDPQKRVAGTAKDMLKERAEEREEEREKARGESSTDE